MFDFFREHPPKQALQIFGLTAAPALVFYIWSSFLPTYANITVGLDVKVGLVTGSISLAVFLVLQPLFGLLSDKIGRKPLLIVFGLFFVFGTVPLLNNLTGSFTSLLIVQLTGLVFIALWSSISSAIASELFPARLRGSGIGFPYALAWRSSAAPARMWPPGWSTAATSASSAGMSRSSLSSAPSYSSGCRKPHTSRSRDHADKPQIATLPRTDTPRRAA